MTAPRCRLLLLDLDGTLVDSAPDLYAAAERLRRRLGGAPFDAAGFRAQVSRGGSAMLRHAFPQLDEAAIAALLPTFLAEYAQVIAIDSRPFPGMTQLLDAVVQARARWGVVTNKPEALAADLLQGLGLASACAVLIGGDTLAQRKPDPEPLWEACRRLDEPVSAALYVGDDRRDIEAARAAGMRCIAAGWGYIGADVDPASWGADAVAASPSELLARRLLVLG